MNLRQLEVFNAVMQAGSITGAAHMLNLSQPAVSKLLQRTEDQLRMPLFKRIGGRLRPTPEALALVPEVERVFSRLRAIRQLSSDLRRNVRGRISLASSLSLAASVAAPAIASFRLLQPEISFSLNTLPSPGIITSVIEGEVEIGLVSAPFTHALTTFQEIGKADLICAMPSDHVLASADVITPVLLRGHPLIAGHGSHSFGALLENVFGSEGELLDVPLQITNSMLACALAARGAGVALADPFTAKQYFPQLTVRKFRPQVPINPRVIYRVDRPLSQLVLAFIEVLRKETAAAQGSID